MTTEDVRREIVAIIADVSGFEEEEIRPDVRLVEDLEMDPIKAIEIAVAIEKKFRVSIRDEDIPKIKTPREIMTLVDSLLQHAEET